jgi:hypothetical protein
MRTERVRKRSRLGRLIARHHAPRKFVHTSVENAPKIITQLAPAPPLVNPALRSWTQLVGSRLALVQAPLS